MSIEHRGPRSVEGVKQAASKTERGLQCQCRRLQPSYGQTQGCVTRLRGPAVR